MTVKPSTYNQARYWFLLFKRAAIWTFPARKHFYPIALRYKYREVIRDWFEEREQKKREKERKLRQKALLRKFKKNQRRRQKEFSKARRKVRKKIEKGVIMLEGKRYYTRDTVRKKLGVGYWNQNKFVETFYQTVKPIYFFEGKYLFSAYQVRLLLRYYKAYQRKQFSAKEAMKRVRLRWENEEIFGYAH